MMQHSHGVCLVHDLALATAEKGRTGPRSVRLPDVRSLEAKPARPVAVSNSANESPDIGVMNANDSQTDRGVDREA